MAVWPAMRPGKDGPGDPSYKTCLDNDTWLNNARHANIHARRLASELTAYASLAARWGRAEMPITRLSRRIVFPESIESEAIIENGGSGHAPFIIPRHVLAQDGNPGANDRIKIGIVGLGLRIRVRAAKTPLF